MASRSVFGMTATAEVEPQTDSSDAVLGYLAEVLATVGTYLSRAPDPP